MSEQSVATPAVPEPPGPGDLDALNLARYRAPGVVARYTGAELHAAEARIFDDLALTMVTGRVLDIGIGAGRTVPRLRARSGSYVGVDYAAEMVAAAQQRYPHADLQVCDARDLSRFADGSFDVVFFSFNGIDYVDDADRAVVLQEALRVLAPGGTYVFSSHNRDHERFGLLPWQRRRRFGRRTLAASLRTLPHLPRHRRMKRLEVHTDGYAIVNDSAHGYSLLAYYVSPHEQVARLAEAGFTDVAVRDQWGEPVPPDATPAVRRSAWLYYTARRP